MNQRFFTGGAPSASRFAAGGRALGLLCGASAMATVMAPVGAFAQAASPTPNSPITTPPNTVATTTPGTIGQVVVTAEHRTENVQKVPIAITAIAGSQLEQKAITRLEDLQYAAPSTQIVEVGYAEYVNIRGIGLASEEPSVVNGVAQYYDGLFQPPVVVADQFYDIADVEVLNGPQGTLVGSNSTGGAIYINSENPHLGDFGGYLQGQYGSYNDREGQGAVNIPVTDWLALRVAGDYADRDSFYKSIGPVDTQAGSYQDEGGRFSALFKPTDNFQALFKAQLASLNTGGFANTPVPGTEFAPYSPPSVYDLDYNTPTMDKNQLQLYGLEMRYTLPDGIVIRSMTGYQNRFFHELYDPTAVSNVPTALLPAVTGNTEDQFAKQATASQEINIISPTTGPLSWIVGGYYQYDTIWVRIHETSDYFPTKIISDNEKNTWGVFGQANYKLTPSLELQVGLRYSGYSVAQQGYVAIGAGIPGFPPTGLDVANLASTENDGAPTGKIDLNWTINDNNMAYAFVARGYKSGGANSAVSTFLPEYVWDYEAGLKSTFLDGHIRTQVDGYYYDYQNFQFTALDPVSGQTGVENFKTTTMAGIEGNIQAHLAHFELDGSFGYEYSDVGKATIVNTRNLPSYLATTPLPGCAAGVPTSATCFQYAPFEQGIGGGDQLLTPEWTFNIGAQYTFDLADGFTLTPRLNYAYVDRSWATYFYSPLTDLLPAHGLLSVLVTLRKDRWTIEAYGTNLTGDVYEAGQQGNNAFYGAPRQGGVRVKYSF